MYTCALADIGLCAGKEGKIDGRQRERGGRGAERERELALQRHANKSHSISMLISDGIGSQPFGPRQCVTPPDAIATTAMYQRRVKERQDDGNFAYTDICIRMSSDSISHKNDGTTTRRPPIHRSLRVIHQCHFHPYPERPGYRCFLALELHMYTNLRPLLRF